jgi:hypothetical protein
MARQFSRIRGAATKDKIRQGEVAGEFDLNELFSSFIQKSNLSRFGSSAGLSDKWGRLDLAAQER